MSSRFVVEANGRSVGLAVRCGGGFRFFATEPRFPDLERKVFPRFRTLLGAVRRRYEGVERPPAAEPV